MVDAEVAATGYIFLLDLGIFFMYILVFFCVRGKRGDKGVTLPNWKGDRDLNNARFYAQDLRPSIAGELENQQNLSH